MYLPHWLSHRAVSGKRSSIQRKSLVIACVPLFRFCLFADAHNGVAQVLVRWHGQIEPRRHAFVKAAGEIELRLVARAEKAVQPIGAEISRRDLPPKGRRAAEIAATSDTDPSWGL